MDTHEQLADALIACLKTGHKILVCGNGGSAAQASHFAGELVGRFETERRALPCICLNTDPAILTAIGNDYGFSSVFDRQVEALGGVGDILLLITTSGNSENLIQAAKKGRRRGMVTIALSGQNGGRLQTQHRLIAPGGTTAEIQESHLHILHGVARIVERAFAEGP